MMPASREQDELLLSTPNRQERVFSQHELWYFHTREGGDVGPFRYRSEAESNLDRFLDRLRCLA